MRVAIVHDWLVTYAGAEKVLTEILRLYPEADLFSLVDHFNEEDRKKIFGKKQIQHSYKISLFQKLNIEIIYL